MCVSGGAFCLLFHDGRATIVQCSPQPVTVDTLSRKTSASGNIRTIQPIFQSAMLPIYDFERNLFAHPSDQF